MLDKLRIKITIVATIIATIISYIYSTDLVKTCYTLIITIVLFYFLGGFIEISLRKKIEELEEQKNKEESQKENFEEFEQLENMEDTENTEPNYDTLDENIYDDTEGDVKMEDGYVK